MKYLLTLWGDESQWDDASPQELAADMERWEQFDREAREAGVLVGGEGLEPTSAATTIRVDDSGERLITDGPFAETKEQLGGYYLLECRDMDHAIEWANRIPAGAGSIEIRPVIDYDAVKAGGAEGAESAAES